MKENSKAKGLARGRNKLGHVEGRKGGQYKQEQRKQRGK